MANFAGSFLQGFMGGRQMKQEVETRKLLPGAMMGDPRAMEELSRVNPEAFMGIQDRMMAQQAAQQQAELDRMKNAREILTTGATLLQALPESARPAAIQAMNAQGAQMFGENWTPIGAEYAKVQDPDLAKALILEDRKDARARMVGGGGAGGGSKAFQALDARAKAGGLVEGTPEYQRFMLSGGKVGAGAGSSKMDEIEFREIAKASTDIDPIVTKLKTNINEFNQMDRELQGIIYKEKDGKKVINDDLDDALGYFTQSDIGRAASRKLSPDVAKLQQKVDSVISRLTVAAGEKLSGAKSDMDIKMLKETMPSVYDSASVWDSWYKNTYQPTVRKIQADINEYAGLQKNYAKRMDQLRSGGEPVADIPEETDIEGSQGYDLESDPLGIL